MSGNPQGTTGRQNMWKTTRDQIVIEEGFNKRFDMGDIPALGRSIAENGLKRALNVQRNDAGKFVVRDGHRRIAGIDDAIKSGLIDGKTFVINILIEDKEMSRADALILMAVANDGKPLLPLEEAGLYKDLRAEINPATGKTYTILDVCKKVGRGDVHVRDRLALLDAAPEVQEAVKAGTVRATLAQQIVAASKKDHKKQAEMIAQAQSKDGKKTLRTKVDPDARKKNAMSLKMRELQTNLDATSEKLSKKMIALIAQPKMPTSRAQLKEKVGAEFYEIIKLIGAETALRELMKGAESKE